MYGPIIRFASATNEAVEAFHPEEDLEGDISSLALRTVVVAAISLFVLTIIAAIVKDRTPRLKMPLFVLMATAMAGSVVVLLISAFYLNSQSDSGGPIHWHADIEYWACGNQLELRDPDGFLSNKIGTPVLHEHDDQRIHMEGVIVDKAVDASLGKFMFVVGGELSDGRLVVPLNAETGRWYEDDIDGDGPSENNTAYVAPYIINDDEHGTMAVFEDSGKCGDEPAEVQAFVYHYVEREDGDVYWQEKLASPTNYTINEEPNVPPGDCVIIEFDEEKDRTTKLCKQFGIRDIDKCEAHGIESDAKDSCALREVGAVTESGEIIELDDLSSQEPTEIKPLDVTETVEEDLDA